MAQYIDKDAVDTVLRKLWKKDNGLSNAARYAYNRALQDIQCEIDALEVKEVDDEKCKEYDKALSIAKAWYKSSDSSAQERNVAHMIMGDKVREEL